MKKKIKGGIKKIVVDNHIYVTSAIELDTEIKNQIKTIFGIDEKYVFVVNKNIIGGITIRKHGQIFDGSISKVLEEMYTKIVTA